MKIKRNVYFVFLSLDLFSLLYYFYAQLIDGRIPFYSDLISISSRSRLFQGIEIWVYMWGISSLILYFSLFLSVFLFFKCHRYTNILVAFQFPLRVIGFIPTIPFMGTILHSIYIYTGSSSLIFYFIVFLVELIKVFVVFYLDKNKKLNNSYCNSDR